MTDKFVVSTNEIGEIIVTDVETDRVYRYDDPSNFFGLIRLLNEQQATINLLLDLLYQSEATVISEYSSHIGEDMDKLDKIFKEKDIKEIERFVGGCDDEWTRRFDGSMENN